MYIATRLGIILVIIAIWVYPISLLLKKPPEQLQRIIRLFLNIIGASALGVQNIIDEIVKDLPDNVSEEDD